MEQLLPDKVRIIAVNLLVSTCQLGPLVIPFARDFSLPTLYIFSTSLYVNIYIYFESIEEHHDNTSADAALESFNSIETTAREVRTSDLPRLARQHTMRLRMTWYIQFSCMSGLERHQI